MERRAEKRLLERRQKRIKVEKEFYDSLDNESGRRLHAADINVGIAHSIRRLAGVVAGRVREYSTYCNDSENESELSDLESDT